jgi:hypothetical protein
VAQGLGPYLKPQYHKKKKKRKRKKVKSGVVVHVCNPNIWEAETEEIQV